MSQAASSSAGCTSSSSIARLRREQAPLALAPPPRLVGDLAFDNVTGLPLIVCPFCKDVSLIADITGFSTKNLGRRYFKCPRSRPGDRTSCPMYKFKEDYEVYLKQKGYLGSTSSLEAELLQEIDDVKLGLEEVKEQVAGMKAPRNNCCCAVFTCINLSILLLGILLVIATK
ncbi:unnamed protein product [Urochloa humidicola]